MLKKFNVTVLDIVISNLFVAAGYCIATAVAYQVGKDAATQQILKSKNEKFQYHRREL